MKNKFQTSIQIIKTSKLPDCISEFKILHLSDLHSKIFRLDNQGLLDEIIFRNPDIIVMTGDMINAKNDNGEVCLQLIKKLNDTFPIYYILGNHEQKIDSMNHMFYENYICKIKALGVIVLDNSNITINIEKAILNIYGLTLDLSYYWNLNRKDRARCFNKNIIINSLGRCNKNEYNILLVHNPKYFDVYTDWGADLILSGHIHGGIIRLPFVGGLLSPERKFFPKYDAGLFENTNGKMIVSRGLGNSTIDFRLFNKPELIEIVIINEK